VYRRLSALLREAGCYFVRHGKGSHEIWFSPLTQRSFSVPRKYQEDDDGERDPAASRAAEGALTG
jgi:hypothetical protein